MKNVKFSKLIICMMISVFVVVFIGFVFVYSRTKETILTQHPDATGNQAMFYTIEAPKGLIVIDGGWTQNAAYVRQVIKEYGGVVDAWILTHPHPDHIGAFNEIYASPDDIEIKEIYTIDMDYERYQSKAKEWDDFSTYDSFVSLTKDEELNYLYTDDEVNICGINVQVFSAYDDTIKKDVANLGSLVFRMELEQDSVLFCSDVYGEEMSNRLADTYGEKLESTYIQMGHHGNNSVKQVLIDYVKPSIALFDAPGWLIYGETYDTIQNMEMLQESGAECYTYETAPNQFVLK